MIGFQLFWPVLLPKREYYGHFSTFGKEGALCSFWKTGRIISKTGIFGLFPAPKVGICYSSRGKSYLLPGPKDAKKTFRTRLRDFRRPTVRKREIIRHEQIWLDESGWPTKIKSGMHMTQKNHFGREPGLQPPHRAKTRDYPPEWTMLCSNRDSCTVTVLKFQLGWPSKNKTGRWKDLKKHFGGDKGIFAAPPCYFAILSANGQCRVRTAILARYWDWKRTMVCSGRDSCTVTPSTVARSRLLTRIVHLSDYPPDLGF